MPKSDDDGDEIMVFRGPSAKSYMDRMFGEEGGDGAEGEEDEDDEFEAFKAFRAAKKSGGTKKAAGARKGYFTKS